ncbi:putative BolA protein [Dioscorea sansibarensis]
MSKLRMGSRATNVLLSRANRIRQKLQSTLETSVLEIEDVSYQHAGHAGVKGDANETHFNVKIVSPKFDGHSLVKRHRMVYDLLADELQSGLHALSIVAKTPQEELKGYICKVFLYLSFSSSLLSVSLMASKGAAASPAALRASSEMEKMSLEQLKAIKEQTDLEVNLLQDSLNNIRTAATRLEQASAALHDLSLRPRGKQMLVPLTASLYVPGTLDDSEKVLIDVGTGYFIEKTMDEGKDYCNRKINLLKSNFDELVEVASKKKSIADEAGLILQAKLRQASTTS